MLTRQGLLKVKTKAVRKGVWYETLSRAERAIVDLTIKCVENVKSPTLAKTVTRILSKISQTLENCFLKRAEKIASDLAKRLSLVAEKWGNKTAQKWRTDKKFIMFLGAVALGT